jgi:hypothetical protein
MLAILGVKSMPLDITPHLYCPSTYQSVRKTLQMLKLVMSEQHTHTQNLVQEPQMAYSNRRLKNKQSFSLVGIEHLKPKP